MRHLDLRYGEGSRTPAVPEEGGVLIVRKGGRIVLLADCRERAASELFHRWMTQGKDPDTIIHKIRELDQGESIGSGSESIVILPRATAAVPVSTGAIA